jgi:CheY-like chemotaxis protein
VNVKLPLSRGLNEGADTARRPSSTSNKSSMPLSIEGRPVCSVGFVGFTDCGVVAPVVGEREAKIKRNLKESFSKCMVDWLRMKPLDQAQDTEEADYVVILADERLKDFIEPFVHDIKRKQPRVIALIPSEMTRSTVENALTGNIKAFEILSAPFGPRKVAKAVSACEKAAETWSGWMRTHAPAQEISVDGVRQPVEDGSKILEEQSVLVKIPEDKKPETLPPPQTSRERSLSFELMPVVQPLTTSEEGGLPLVQRPPQVNGIKQPRRLLLVDDNYINLRLLETFVRKRKGGCQYDCAENGLQAVEKFRSRSDGYAIIFMDISMPIMDGLEATRRIREIEKDRKASRNGTAEGLAPAIIVALTGLANSRDQVNCFSSGVDLFMTKPAKFKEIGKLLDDFFKV